MDEDKKKRLAAIIAKELSRTNNVRAPKATPREITIKVVSIVGGLMFLLNSFVYYGDLFGGKNKKPANANPQVPAVSSKEINHTDAFKKMGDKTLSQNKEMDEIEHYKQAVQNNPKEPKMLLNLVNLLVKNKQYEDSLVYLEKLIDIEPTNISVYRVKGSSLYMLQRYEEAIKVFAKVVEMDPKDNNSYKLMGDMSLNLHQFEDAVNYYKKALAIKDQDVPVYQNLGLASTKMGKFDEALQYYDKALQIDPQNKAILINKQEILNALKK